MTSDGSNRASLFPPDYRASGVLLHLTSLPSQYGIGDAGPAAYRWVDWLVEAGQSWWQMLPLGPTGYGNSPYQSTSTFAFNEMLVSPDRLIEEGLLAASDCEPVDFPADRVDFDAVIPYKNCLLERAWENYRHAPPVEIRAAFERFGRQQQFWLDDYATFMALRDKHGGAAYRHWPEPLVRRDQAALDHARAELAERIECYRFRQFLAFRHWAALRTYAQTKRLWMLGDLPIFVADDSADVWANPELFLLDEQQRPRLVAGVPPDYFSATGQLWGNPLYDWQRHAADGYRWWIERLKAALAQVDLIRLDHFRAFDAAWHVPADSPTAETGQWTPGPGAHFLATLEESLGGLPLVAEDLGIITDSVRELRDQFNLPGMRVLQFAFDGMPDNPFMPERYVHNTVVYTGTHDNDTTRGWYASQSTEQRELMWKLLNRPACQDDDVPWEMIRLALESVAALAIVPLQDLLSLADGRMNLPGQADGNWGWRFTPDMPVQAALGALRKVCERSRRLPTERVHSNRQRL